MAAISRMIYNVNYRLGEARIYEKTPYVAGMTRATNNRDEEADMSVSVEFEEEKSYSFNHSTSAADEVPTTLQAGIPIIVGDDSIQIGHGITISPFQWGQTTTSSTTAHASGSFVLPPNSVATVTYGGTKANCDVPFSYTQRDILADGVVTEARKADGIFKGSNPYNLGFTVHT